MPTRSTLIQRTSKLIHLREKQSNSETDENSDHGREGSLRRSQTKERDRKQVPTKFKTSNARAMTKMKAIRLILEADSSTESSVAASQGCTDSEAGAELNVETVVREKEMHVEKDLWTLLVSPTPIVKRWATRKEKGKAIMMEEVTL